MAINSFKISFDSWDSDNSRDLYVAAKEIYGILSNEEKKMIDDAGVTIHKEKLFAIPTESTLADELLCFCRILINSNNITRGLELFSELGPHCSWRVHFFIQNYISPLLKNNRGSEFYDILLYNVCADFYLRDSYLIYLKGARMPSWERLLNELLEQKNLFLAEKICDEGIANNVPYGTNGYEKKKSLILKKKEDIINSPQKIEIGNLNGYEFDYFYRKVKEKLFEYDLFEDIVVEEIIEKKYIVKYHDIILYCFLLLGEGDINMLFQDVKEKDFYGIQIVLDNLDKTILDLKDKLSKVFLA